VGQILEEMYVNSLNQHLPVFFSCSQQVWKFGKSSGTARWFGSAWNLL
jgi:phosphoribosyl-AMP cyclohydrolase